MSEKPIAEVVAQAEAVLRQRNTHRVTVAEADYLAGAMTVLQAIYGTDDNKLAEGIPPWWTIAPMSGRPVFEDCPPPGEHISRIQVDDLGMPNLDDCTFEERALIREVFNSLTAYTRLRDSAATDRLNGRLEEAAKTEAIMQRIYDALPDWAKW